ncbi:hypothetical protein PR048_009796 [Dryococelus australis]|uniref:Uncharacterized protein n=1 Tax=Dryococelus australis TaxID=614101 RepID=A0ABQ9I2R7_9NEOP|nr:hypothetical protein PR048_009796 [Dryococelus australis]
MDVFNSSSSSSDSVAAAGETFFLAMNGVKSQSNLDTERHHQYIKTVAKQQVGGSFNLATLPPTSSAARQHCLRVYLQVQQWRNVDLSPTKWGWMLHNDMLLPVPTLQKAAPDNLMKLEMCNCKISYDKYCECKRSGLNVQAFVVSVLDTVVVIDQSWTIIVNLIPKKTLMTKVNSITHRQNSDNQTEDVSDLSK